MRFPKSSVGKESACNAGHPSSIPGSGRSPGEGIGYLVQSSWASLVAQVVKNLLTMREAWVQSLGWEDALEKGTANHSRILAWRIPWGRKERLSDFHFHFLFMYICISSHIFYCCYKPLPLHWAFAVLWSFPLFFFSLFKFNF